MKFKDLKEGKKYKAIAPNGKEYVYTVSNGLLWLCGEGFSKIRLKEINEMEFKECLPYNPADYKTFDEAVEHMKRGKYCYNLHTGIPSAERKSLATKWYLHRNALMLFDNGMPRTFIFNLDYLKPKWILVDKDIKEFLL